MNSELPLDFNQVFLFTFFRASKYYRKWIMTTN